MPESSLLTSSLGGTSRLTHTAWQRPSDAKVARRPLAPRIVLEFAIKTCFVLDS